jgi:hypothetical protein
MRFMVTFELDSHSKPMARMVGADAENSSQRRQTPAKFTGFQEPEAVAARGARKTLVSA